MARVTSAHCTNKENSVQQIISLYHIAIALAPGSRWQAVSGNIPAPS